MTNDELDTFDLPLDTKWAAKVAEVRTHEANVANEAALSVERSVARKIQSLREERGWSQAELARRLGLMGFPMHQTTVAKLEAGRRPLRVAELVAVGAIFDLPPAAFLYLPPAGESVSIPCLRHRLGTLDDQIRQKQEQFQNALTSHATTYVGLVLERERAVTEMRRAAAVGDDDKHPEET